MIKIGAHVSASGGLYKAIENAQKIGADCFQIFGASPRQWMAKQPSTDDILKYKTLLKKSGLGPVFLHSAYLVNLASPSAENRQKSIKSLIDHLVIADQIGAVGLVFHVGSGKGMPTKKSIGYITKGIKEVLKKVPGKTKLILENDAGGGGRVGGLEEIGEIIKQTKTPRVKVCLDTAHALEANLIDDYTPDKTKKFLSDFDQKIGLKNLIVLHINDSKTPAGSNHDRHANIGEGYIGKSGFKNLSLNTHLRQIPWILEVPGFDNLGPDKKNIDLLRRITK